MTLTTGAGESQIKVCKLLLDVSKRSILYNLSLLTLVSTWTWISADIRKKLLSDQFFLTFLTVLIKLQTEAWRVLVKVWKDLVLYRRSISILGRKWFFQMKCWIENRHENVTAQGLKDFTKGLEKLTALQSINPNLSPW